MPRRAQGQRRRGAGSLPTSRCTRARPLWRSRCGRRPDALVQGWGGVARRGRDAAPQVIKPSWQATPDGDYRLARAGTVLLELAPVVSGGGSQPGERRCAHA